MVSHPLHKGIQCEILAKGSPLEEHEVGNDESKHPDLKIAAHEDLSTVTKFVESTSGEAFKIKVTVDKTRQLDCSSLYFCAIIDGETIEGPVLTQAEFGILSEGWSDYIEGAVLGNTLRPFLFSMISITSDDVSAEETKKLKERLSSVGEIVVKVYRQGDGGEAIFDEDTHFREADYDVAISEKALKGKVGEVSHGTSLGEARPIHGPARWVAGFIDGMDKPIAIFCFKYRSKEALAKISMRADPAAHVIDLTEAAAEETNLTVDGSQGAPFNTKRNKDDESESATRSQSTTPESRISTKSSGAAEAPVVAALEASAQREAPDIVPSAKERIDVRPRIALSLLNIPENELENENPEALHTPKILNTTISEVPVRDQAVPEIAALARNEEVEGTSAKGDAAVGTAEAVARNFSSTVKVEKSDDLQTGEQELMKKQTLSIPTIKSEGVKVENVEMEIKGELIKAEIKTEDEPQTASRGLKRKTQQQQLTHYIAKKSKMMGKVTVFIDLTEVEEEEEKMRNAIVID